MSQVQKRRVEVETAGETASQRRRQEVNMKLLCIDPGLACTGLAVIEHGAVLHYDHVQTGTELTLAVRLARIGYFVESVCRGRGVDSVRIELPPAPLSRPGRFARVMNAEAIQGLTLATGAIIFAAVHSVGGNIELVPPAGNTPINGRKVRPEVKKRIARAVVLQRYGLKVNEHVAEAILLAVPATTAETAAGWVTVREAGL